MLSKTDIEEALNVLASNNFTFNKAKITNGDNFSQKNIIKKVKIAEENYNKTDDFNTKNIYFKMKTGFDLALDFDIIYKSIEKVFKKVFKTVRNEVLYDYIVDNIYKVFNDINKFDGKKSMFLTWLFVVVKNNYLGYEIKKNSRYILTDSFLEYEDIFVYDIFDTLDVELDFSVTLKVHDVFINNVYPNLKSEYKIALQKREFEHKSYDDISKELKLNLNTTKSRIKLARESVIKKLKKQKIKALNNTDYYE